MKIFRCCLGFLVIFLACTLSCGRKLSPTSTIDSNNKDFDADAFNYVFVEAIKQKLMGNSGDALKYFEQCIKINPHSDATYYQMAQIVINNGDIKHGKQYGYKALSMDEKNIWYLMLLAGIYYQEKNLDSAIVFYEKAVFYYPEKDNLKLTLGSLYADNNNFSRALVIFEYFDRKYGINQSSTLASVKSLVSTKKYSEALAKTNSLIQQYPEEIIYKGLLAEIYSGIGDNSKARMIYNDLVDKEPDNPQTQLSLFDFLMNEKSYDELFPLLNSIFLNSKVKRDDKVSLSARLIQLDDLKEDNINQLLLALMVLEANYKEDDIIPLLRPEYLIKVQKLREASDRLEDIIKTKKDNYYAWEKLLLVYLQMKDYSKLLLKGEECSTRFNRSFLAKLLYANGAMEYKKYSIALEELRKAEILAGDNSELILQVLTMRADVYYRMKDYTKAFQIFEIALSSNKEDLTVMNNYAYYLAEQNMKLKEAEAMAKKVVENGKGNTTFLDTYGWVLYKRGKLNEAAKIMASIINSGENPDAEWFEHYGYILKKQKNCTKAIDNWSTALKLDSTKKHLIKEIENCKK